MSKEQLITAIEGMVQQVIADDPGYFLVSVKVSPSHQVKVFLDADTGVSIDRCVTYNRLLYKELEASGLFPPGDFSLEVSSPGLDEPLKLHRQYRKNIGRKVEVTPVEGAPVQGVLASVTDESITLQVEQGKGRKKDIVAKEIPLSGVKTVRVMIVF
jgi:ribosome maturation factor RimP